MVTVTSVDNGSHAHRAGILAGDILVSINGNEIRDVLDYRFYLTDRVVRITMLRDGEEYEVTVKKGEYSDIGLSFETPLMDKKHSCRNGCIFCFIDQNPKGLRDSLYFKDDDSRLSFLHGNYITLTNMNDEDVARIVKMRFSPINISVHTTDPELRVKMMKNKRAGEVLRYLDDFYEAGLGMCAQIVLCRKINDGDALRSTLKDLSRYYPRLSSIAVVPAGLTRHRDGLYPLSEYTPEEAAEIISLVNSFGDNFKKTHGTRLVYAADELYLKAGIPIPDEDYYEDYSQIENGVGMLRSFSEEFEIGLGDIGELLSSVSVKRVSVATGVAAYPTVLSMARRISALSGAPEINVYPIRNFFFGESITVSGLLTGKDIYEQLRDKDLGDRLLIPSNALRSGEEVFLCGMTVDELSERLSVDIRISQGDGFDFIDAVLGR